MACFIVPAMEAVTATVVTKIVQKQESDGEIVKVCLDGTNVEEVQKIPFSHKLKWLTNLLWGGSGLLAFEHFWHGEIVPWFPFLTAAQNPQDLAEMLREMATTGVAMVALVTVVWCIMLGVTHSMEKAVLVSETVKGGKGR